MCLFSVSDPDSTQKTAYLLFCQMLQDLGILMCVLDRASVVTEGEIKLLESLSPVKQHLWLPGQRSKAVFCTQLILELSCLFLDSLGFFGVGCPVIFAVGSGSMLAVALSCWEW